MKTIFMTGATGFIGSTLVPLLLERGYRVLCLVRAVSSEIAQQRLSAIVGPASCCKNCIAVCGDVTAELAGVSPEVIAQYSGQIDTMLHSAALIKFDGKDIESASRAVNVGGTRQVLALSELLGAREFHYVSTAYVAGDSEVFYEDDIDIGQSHRNPYERTKLEAEKLVRAWATGDRRFTIHRLSIVVGDSKTGFTTTFDGYYGYLSAFWGLVQTFCARLREKPAEYAGTDLYFDEHQLHLPVWIECSPKSTLNLVPVDWVADMMSALIARPCRNKTYHIVHDNPCLVMWATYVSLGLLGMSGFTCSQERPNLEQSRPVARVQRMLERQLKRYEHYVTREPRFETGALKAELGDEYYDPPRITERLFKTLLGYALSVEFGKK